MIPYSTLTNLPRLIGMTAIIIGLSAVHNVLLVALPIFSLEVMSRVLPANDTTTLASLAVLLLGAVLTDMLIERSRIAGLSRLLGRFAIEIQSSLLKRAGDPREALRSFEQVSALRTHLVGPVGVALLDLPWSSVFLLGLFYINKEVGFIAIVSMGAVFLVGVVNSLSAAARRRQLALAQAHMGATALGLSPRLARSSGGRARAMKSMTSVLVTCGAWVEASGRAAALSHGIRVVAQAALIGAAAILTSNGEMATGALLATSMLFARALAPVERCSDIYTITEIIRLTKELHRAVTGIEKRHSLGNFQLGALTGSIAVERLTLRRDTRAVACLRDVTFTCNPGELTILMGPSGAGKSMLLALLSGELVPTSGSVMLDGHSLRDVDFGEIPNLIGYLSSTPAHIAGTFFDVIADGHAFRPQAVVAAARLAGIHDRIVQLPGQYSGLFCLESTPLSRGERQLIYLARAFYEKPKVLVLDEPTAFLDEQGEDNLISALFELRNSGSNIIVATRSPRLVAAQDQTLFLREGTLSGRYTKKELEAHVSKQKLETA